MHDAIREIGPTLRALGFKGSRRSYRKSEADFVFVVSFQGSKWGDLFFVNLGAQPTFVPAEGHADLAKLKEYECILRRRVGQEWRPSMDQPTFAAFRAQLLETQDAFFGHARRLPQAIATKAPETLLDEYDCGTTRARATLHLARAAAKLGQYTKARELAQLGLELAGDGATMLQAELKDALASLSE